MEIIFFGLALAWLLGLAVTSLRRTELSSEIRKDLLVAAIYVPLSVGFFWQIILDSGAHISRGYGNLASTSFPALGFAADSVQQGVLPLWNPFLYGGHPIFADAGAALFYPFNLVAIIVSKPFTFDTVQQLVILHVTLAAIFTFAYARVLSASRLGALAAGVLFAFGGFATSRLDSLNIVEGFAWLPLLLFFFHLGLRRRSLVFGALSGAVFGLSILAGNTQLVLYVGVVLVAYWAWSIIAGPGRSAGSLQSRMDRKRMLALPLCLGAALGIAAIQVVPTLQLMRLSLGRQETLAAIPQLAVSPLHLVSVVVPYFFGENLGGSWGISGQVSEAYAYVGIPSLVLAVFGALAWKRKMEYSLFFVVLGVVSLALGVIEPLFLHRLLLRFVPGFAKSNPSVHSVILFNLAVAILAARGFDSLGSFVKLRARPSDRTLVAVIAICLVGVAFLLGGYFYYYLLVVRSEGAEQFQRGAASTDSLILTLLFLVLSTVAFLVHRYSRRYRRLVPIVLVTVLILDIFSANSGFNVSRKDILAKQNHPEVASLLRSELGQARIDTMTGVAEVWEQSNALLNKHPDATGPGSPFMLDDYYRFWENLGSRSAPAYDLLGIRYVLTSRGTHLDQAKFNLAPTASQVVWVHENVSALPRAMIVPSADIVPRGDMLSRLRSSGFTPRETVLLEADAPPVVEVQSKGPAGEILKVELPSVNEVRITARATRSAFLVLNDAYYPGWKAFIDDKEVPLLRANYTFRAVSFPEGVHQARMVFEPSAFIMGAAVSTVSGTLLFLIVLGAFLVGRRKAVNPEPPTEQFVGT